MGGDTDRIRVVLVDDEELIRAGLALVLASEPDIDVIGEAGEGTSGINAIASLRPDVVVMDVRMRGTDGVTATRLLNSEEYEAEHGTPPPVLILTTFGDDEDVDSALRSGAAEFLLKNSAPQILAAAIRALARGEGWIDSSVTRSLLRQFSNASGPDSNQVRRRLTGPAELRNLTQREQEVLAAMARGLKNSQIAKELFLSETTVKSHVHRILMKLGLNDRSQAVAVAFRSGLVGPEGK
ncbi:MULTISPECIES: response regulator transcription factor [Paenarthrobacter]|uniref:Response regulator transcription factor n=1 Tax=Paenarthrobacter ureafaciens TaxID=37931 RepID=A0AAX3EKH2_PAEUR|nr:MULTISPECIES: response regulator transcription factor [Paenarthrobacter]NKR13509.1 DNA-binding response regulator [Arthrobacter sp. M5]NKR17172.1 DNA-binding response regulator [Arthrobacter sp. M6]OEH61852.1 DNA-binding response regulator [Arthrobacter sp. D4]OEH64154.1 DNA-binding response regulator [Arthrobacter sp. D2]MDO5863481.1 response regulator transcription factor [Paenarthrobacter sp. SD-2]